MVRSNSEIEHRKRRELFHLVERIRTEDKYFNVSRAELARQLEGLDSWEIYSLHETEDEDGAPVSAELRLNIARRPLPKLCSVALKLHQKRIDGIDYHERFDAPDGASHKGWHRHGWRTAERDAEQDRIPIPGFGNGLADIEEFLIRMGRELRIVFSATDVGISDNLPFT